jgi:hypothetical protein
MRWCATRTGGGSGLYFSTITIQIREAKDLVRSQHRSFQQLSTAATSPSTLTVLRSVGLLDGLHEYACAGLGRDTLSGRHPVRIGGSDNEVTAVPNPNPAGIGLETDITCRIFCLL